MGNARGHIRIGTSGWHYAHWRGPFYPADTPPERFLDYYASCFDTVEINNTFYRLPRKSAMAAWRDAVPKDFLFPVKASRYITHMKKLKEPAEALDAFFDTVASLGEKLGPVLFQLPPRWRLNTARLEAFLDELSAGRRYAFEFRDHSWQAPAVFDRLKRVGAALCFFDLDGYMSPQEVTADFVYIRLHGPNGPYKGSYTDSELSGWAGKITAWAAEGLDVFCYFDNDEAGYAALDALRLLDLIGR